MCLSVYTRLDISLHDPVYHQTTGIYSMCVSRRCWYGGGTGISDHAGVREECVCVCVGGGGWGVIFNTTISHILVDRDIALLMVQVCHNTLILFVHTGILILCYSSLCFHYTSPIQECLQLHSALHIQICARLLYCYVTRQQAHTCLWLYVVFPHDYIRHCSVVLYLVM